MLQQTLRNEKRHNQIKGKERNIERGSQVEAKERIKRSNNRCQLPGTNDQFILARVEGQLWIIHCALCFEPENPWLHLCRKNKHQRTQILWVYQSSFACRWKYKLSLKCSKPSKVWSLRPKSLSIQRCLFNINNSNWKRDNFPNVQIIKSSLLFSFNYLKWLSHLEWLLNSHPFARDPEKSASGILYNYQFDWLWSMTCQAKVWLGQPRSEAVKVKESHLKVSWFQCGGWSSFLSFAIICCYRKGTVCHQMSNYTCP